jgi:cyclopropane fatty-acyl-phospholipid synthase-like methyltransferase
MMRRSTRTREAESAVSRVENFEVGNQVMNTSKWWDEAAGFFGDFYFDGDHSQEGHVVAKKMSLDERTAREANGVAHLLALKEGQRILDVPCGYGRHAISLAHRGYDVVGVDLNEQHLQMARSAAAADGLEIKFVKGDMLTLSMPQKFDAVINMFYSFGFFDTDEENMTVLRNFRHVLRPGGQFLMHTDVNVPRVVSCQYKTSETRSLVSGGTLRIREQYNRATKRIDGAWIIDKDGQTEEKLYSVRVYEVAEFTAMCLQAGFKSCTAFGSWEGGRYSSQDSEEIVFVAKN